MNTYDFVRVINSVFLLDWNWVHKGIAFLRENLVARLIRKKPKSAHCGNHRRNRGFAIVRCEALEDRALLAASAVTTTALGTLSAGRVYQGGDEVSFLLNAIQTHRYTFTTTSEMEFTAQLNVRPDFFGNFEEGHISLAPDVDNSSSIETEFTSSNGKATITQTLAPGSYVASVIDDCASNAPGYSLSLAV
jgi:hypothetical protein